MGGDLLELKARPFVHYPTWNFFTFIKDGIFLKLHVFGRFHPHLNFPAKIHAIFTKIDTSVCQIWLT